MRVLVTGGTGVVGASTVTALLNDGHAVRLLSRHAGEDVDGWEDGVEPWQGDIADAASLQGAADGCEAVIHLVGIVDENPPKTTFQSVNVEGTRHIMREADRAGVRRFVYVSSLGAEGGTSPYHRSKHEGEQVARTFPREWVILRPGAVYGPGDEHMSVLLRMVRTLPVVPLVSGGDQEFQPAWHEDIAKALAESVVHPGVVGKAIDLAGAERTTQKAVVKQLREITGRDVPLMPVPEVAAQWGIKLMDAVGIGAPVAESQLRMLVEGNVIRDGGSNGLTEVFGIRPTPLAEGLRRFVDEQPESLPSDGVGSLRRKLFSAELRPSSMDASTLSMHLRRNLAAMMPSIITTNPEPGDDAVVDEGETLTLALPARGNVQVRVGEARDCAITLLTVEGHPLAGAVRFLCTDIDGGVRFEIQVFERAGSVVDLLVMRTVGDLLQDATWRQMVQNTAQAVGLQEVEVDQQTESLEGPEADQVEQWAHDLAMALRREEREESDV
jgi:uncharacterized protein YbjT (DUF2867 family)